MPRTTTSIATCFPVLSLVAALHGGALADREPDDATSAAARRWSRETSVQTMTATAHGRRTVILRLDGMKPVKAKLALAKFLASTGGRVVYESQLVEGMLVVETSTSTSMSLHAAKAEPEGFLWSQPNYTLHTTATNDEHWPLLWGLHNDGSNYQNPGYQDDSMPGTTGVDIRAEEAWQTQPDGNGVVVAVIDSGIDISHPDLREAIWVNADEIPGNGIDDDSNGYIDDVNGWSFVHDGPHWQGQSHGTHCAGTIAATGNNQQGIVGVAPGARIMPLQFINGDQGGDTASAVRAIEYAVANGARISNNSWGSQNYDPAIAEVMQQAAAQGHLMIVAAGNAGGACEFPANLDNDHVVAVAANRPDGTLATFSAHGSGVDLAAPGWGVVSCVPDGYQYMAGTSMAAPHVTGVAALLLAADPDADAGRLRHALLSSVRQMGSLSGAVETGGMLDAAAALQALGEGSNGDGGDGEPGGGEGAYGLIAHTGGAPERMSLLLEPQGMQFVACREDAITALPAGNGGQALQLGDEDKVTLQLQHTFPWAGESLNQIQVHSNGSITFTDATENDWQGTPEMFAIAPRVAPMFTDLDPSAGGSIRVQHLQNRTVVSWVDVPAYGADQGNTMQAELFADGRIRMSWMDLPAFGSQNAIIGLGAPDMGQAEADFTQQQLCQQDPPAGDPCHEDINGDGQVQVEDLIMVLQAWGQCE